MNEGSAQLDVVIEPVSSRFEPNDAGWRNQVVALRRQFAGADIDGVRRTEIPSPGHKAGIEAVILALGTSGAITAAVEIMRVWLSRDGTRSLRVGFRDGDRKVTLQVDGTRVSDAAITEAMTAALGNLAGGAGTPPGETGQDDDGTSVP